MAHRLQNIYSKIETAPGTPIAVAGTDSLELDTCVFRYLGDPIQRKPIRTNRGGEKPAPVGPRHVEMDLAIELKAASAAATPPEFGRLLQALGLTEAIGASVAYTPTGDANAATTAKSLTIVGESDLDGNTYATYGVRCSDGVISHKQGERAMLTCKGMGGYTAVVDQPALLVPTSYGTVPFSLLTTFTLGAYTPIISEWSLTIPAKTSLRPHGAGAASTGYFKWPTFVMWDGNPILSVTCEAADQTAWTMFANYIASTAVAGTIVLGDGTRTLTISLPSCTLNGPTPQASAGAEEYQLSFVCGATASPAITITSA